MASVISASTTSATALNMSADTTGVLQLATGATPTTAVTIDTSQNVGIGTASPSTYVGASGGLVVAQDITLVNNTTQPANNYPRFFQLSGVGPSISGFQFTVNTGGNATTAPTERMRIDSNGQNTMTTTIGYAQLRNITGTTVAASGTVDFPSMSGMLIVNNWSQGTVVIFSCGGGLVSTVNTNGLYGGSVAYRAAINGYRWTSNAPTTSDYSFTLISTRPAA